MAAKNGVAIFERPNKTKMGVSFYLDDTAGNPVRWARDGKAGAGSLDRLYTQEWLGLLDFCIEGATGQTTTVFKLNGVPVSTILNANNLASVVTRAELALVVPPGSELTATQLA